MRKATLAILNRQQCWATTAYSSTFLLGPTKTWATWVSYISCSLKLVPHRHHCSLHCFIFTILPAHCVTSIQNWVFRVLCFLVAGSGNGVIFLCMFCFCFFDTKRRQCINFFHNQTLYGFRPHVVERLGFLLLSLATSIRVDIYNNKSLFLWLTCTGKKRFLKAISRLKFSKS